MRENWTPRLRLVAAIWTIPTVYWALQAMAQARRVNKPYAWTTAFGGEILYAGTWVALTFLIFWVARRFPLHSGRRAAHIAVHLAAGMVFSLGHRIVWLAMMQAVFESYTTQDYWKMVLSFLGLDIGFFIYWVTLLVYTAANYYSRYRREELRRAQLEAQLAQAQLQSLRMQLHPHFLFNTLHTISALVHEDADAAERVIARLSDLLRYSLENAGEQTTTLRQELEFLKRYLEIEQVRFADRLKVDYQVDPATLDLFVPNLILQPLVENAIRHGIGSQIGPGRIQISAHRENGTLHMAVTDNGRGLPGQRRDGVGLGATRARLAGLYGADQKFEVRNASGGGTEALIEIAAGAHA